jgi:hypothetical protein
VKHFNLSNPRQLKRLNNSFNLLRNFYGEDEIPEAFDTSDDAAKYAFPMLVTLCALEHLNNINELELRISLKRLLAGEKITLEEENKLGDHKITLLVRGLASQTLSNTTMVEGIEPFVLPAVE